MRQMVLKRRSVRVLWFVALTIILLPVSASGQSVNSTISSCRRFAQSFYGWYVPFTQKELKHPAFEIALERKTTVFSPALLRALTADSEAQRKANGELIGIDFDPFVGSQDPADHYDTRKITLRGDVCVVEVWRNSPSDTAAKSDKPDVVAELSHRAGQWQFENFRYPSLNADLMTVLASLRKERRRQR